MFCFYITDTIGVNRHRCLVFDEFDTGPACRPSFEEGGGCPAAPSRSSR